MILIAIIQWSDRITIPNKHNTKYKLLFSDNNMSIVIAVSNYLNINRISLNLHIINTF